MREVRERGALRHLRRPGEPFDLLIEAPGQRVARGAGAQLEADARWHYPGIAPSADDGAPPPGERAREPVLELRDGPRLDRRSRRARRSTRAARSSVVRLRLRARAGARPAVFATRPAASGARTRARRARVRARRAALGPLRAVLRLPHEFDGRQNGGGDFDGGTYIQRSNVVTTPHWRDPPRLAPRAREAVVPVLTLAELLEHQYFAPSPSTARLGHRRRRYFAE